VILATLTLLWVLSGLVPLAFDISRLEWWLGLRAVWRINWRFAVLAAVTGPIIPGLMFFDWLRKKSETEGT
jgi:hypothetical protein